MTSPLVTVICLCYNQNRFVREAIESVMQQTYKNIQLVVVDDASTDGSADQIRQMKKLYSSIEVLLLEKNVGNCKAFNAALVKAKGNYLIDLAADDVLLRNRIELGVEKLLSAENDYGVHFGDAEYIDEAGNHLYYHSDKFPHHTIPQGDVYKNVVERYFICPPTVMFTRQVFDALGGYDENLLFEDFDVYVRSSRMFKYVYSPMPLVKRRITAKPLSANQFKLFNRHSLTTFAVCEKILTLNKNRDEQQALSKRILYEIKLNIRLLNVMIVVKYLLLWLKNNRLRYA
jgi:glycosyltransferase involved in cell wall biosynthesis